MDVLMEETRRFPPKKQEDAEVPPFAEAAHDLLAFWEKEAENLYWFQRWNRVLEWKCPYGKWFLGGKINACYNAVDRHVESDQGSRRAIIWEGERGETRTLTYDDLYKEVVRMGSVLRSFGVDKGDRVAIYLPLVPEAAIAMLACARIGAIHTVVFGGFSAAALRGRVDDAGAKVLITADGGMRRGNIVPFKAMADEALRGCKSIEKVLLIRHLGTQVDVQDGRDVWYHESSEDKVCAAEPMDSEDLLFILYTSGTTGKPKGIMHSTGGYLLGAHRTCRWVFDLRDSDIYWCTADVGWITGHTYLVYGPLANCATVLMYEGAPDYPEKDRMWELVEKHKVTILYTAPTAIRACMKWGKKWPEGRNLSSLRMLGSVGEPINPQAWMWYYETIGQSRCPIVDTWWQTETGSIMITPIPGYSTLKPGSAIKPLPGIEAAVLDQDGKPLPEGGGMLSITSPWPSMLRGVWNDPKRYLETYWSTWEGKYFTGDGAHLDKEGDFWLLGRVDDVISVAGHRIGAAEVESALVDHLDVAEAAVVGIEDEVKGEAIAAFVILKEGRSAGRDLEKVLCEHVGALVGPIAKPKKLIFTPELPKTRSGKIMRRLLRDIAQGKVLGDVTTLADASIIQSLQETYKEGD